MAYVPMEKILKINDNIYKVALLASKRALELSEGAQPLVSHNGSGKIATIALQEIQQGKVYIKEDKKPEKAKTRKGKAK